MWQPSRDPDPGSVWLLANGFWLLASGVIRGLRDPRIEGIRGFKDQRFTIGDQGLVIPYMPIAWNPASTSRTSALTARPAELSRNIAASATSPVSTVRRNGARSR